MPARIRSFALAGLVAVMASVLPAGTALAHCEQIAVESYNVEIGHLEAGYSRGERFGVDLTVTRKDTGMPVAGAETAVGAITRKRNGDDLVFFGFGPETDANGRATVALKVPRKAKVGAQVEMFAYVYSKTIDTVCATVLEYGLAHLDPAFRVKR